MSIRSLSVAHFLLARVRNNTQEVFLYPHPKWRDPGTGRPLFTLPVTKLHGPPTDDHVQQRAAAVFEHDLGLPASEAPRCEPVTTTLTETHSPTAGVRSAYAVAAVTARVPLARHGRIARAVKGEWLAPADALNIEHLSPTARAVLELALHRTLVPTPPPPALGSAEQRELTALLVAARNGDMDRFGEFVERVRPKMTGQLRKYRLRGVLSAEDAFNKGVVRALERLERFDPAKGTGTSWMWVLTYRAAIDDLRDDGDSAGLAPEAAAALVGRELDPGVLAASNGAVADLLARLEKALAAASPKERKAWAMQVEQEIPYDKVAAALKVPRGTVATWIYKIRQKALAGRTDRA